MMQGLRSGKSLAALFGDVFGNVKGSFAITAEMLIARDEESRWGMVVVWVWVIDQSADRLVLD